VLLFFPSFDFDFDLDLRRVSSILFVLKPFFDLLNVRRFVLRFSFSPAGSVVARQVVPTPSAPDLDFSFANQSSLVRVPSRHFNWSSTVFVFLLSSTVAGVFVLCLV
jgi:hypothetical protein